MASSSTLITGIGGDAATTSAESAAAEAVPSSAVHGDLGHRNVAASFVTANKLGGGEDLGPPRGPIEDKMGSREEGGTDEDEVEGEGGDEDYLPTTTSAVDSPSSAAAMASSSSTASVGNKKFATAQTPRHCNTKNRGGGDNNNAANASGPDDDDDNSADDANDDGGACDDRPPPPPPTHRHSNSDQVPQPPNSAAARGGENQASSSQGEFLVHFSQRLIINLFGLWIGSQLGGRARPKKSRSSCPPSSFTHQADMLVFPRSTSNIIKGKSIRHYENWDDQRHLHVAYDGTAHEWRGTRGGGGRQHAPPYPYHHHPSPGGASGAHPSPAGAPPYHDVDHYYQQQHPHQNYGQYYDDHPYDGGRYDYPDHHPHHPAAMPLPHHHRPPHVAYRGSAAPSDVRRHRPPHPYHRPRHPHHPPPPGHARPTSTAGTMVDPQHTSDHHHPHDLEHGDSSHHDAHRHHRALHHHPYPAPRGGGVGSAYDYSYHRYDPSAPLSPPLLTQRREDCLYAADQGYPPASRGEGATEHHHGGVVVAGGERRLPTRSPRQHHHHLASGGSGEEVGSSSVGGRLRQEHHPDRVLPDGATMSTEVDGSMASVRHSASSSIGASIHAVSSSYSNEGSRHMSAAKQSPGVITNSSGGEFFPFPPSIDQY